MAALLPKLEITLAGDNAANAGGGATQTATTTSGGSSSVDQPSPGSNVRYGMPRMQQR